MSWFRGRAAAGAPVPESGGGGSPAPLVAATGRITISASLAPSGHTWTLTDGDGDDAVSVQFGWQNAPGLPVIEHNVNYGSGPDAAELGRRLAACVNAQPGLRVVAVDNGDGTVDLTNGCPGAHGNVTITESGPLANFAVEGMAGGSGSNPAASALARSANLRDLPSRGAAGEALAVGRARVHAAGHGLVAGACVRGYSGLLLADTSGAATAEAVEAIFGVVAEVVDADNVVVATAGGRYDLGNPNLSGPYYVDQTTGGLTGSRPSAGWLKQIGVVIRGVLYVCPGPAVAL